MVVGDEIDVVAALQGQGAQVPAEVHDRLEVGRSLDGLRRELVGCRPDGVVGLTLSGEPAHTETGATQDQEEHEPRQGQDHDEDEPRHGDRRLAIAREDPDRQDLDDVVGHHQHRTQHDQKVRHVPVSLSRDCGHPTVEPVAVDVIIR